MATLTYYAFADTALKKYVVYEKMLAAPLDALPNARMPASLDGPTTVVLATRMAEAAAGKELADAANHDELDEKAVEEILYGILRKYPIVAVVETRGENTHMITHDLFHNASSYTTPEKDVIELVATIVTKISAERGYPIIADGMSLHEVERRLKELAAHAPGILKRTWARTCDLFRPKRA